MDCRKFHRSLEDYLEGGLDFAGRFGMERHAQQCISCGNVMNGAQRLSQMARELGCVRAPSDFESSVLNEIAKSKLHSRFSCIRRYWIFGFERPSWGKLALTAVSLAVLGFALFYPVNRTTVYEPAAPPSIAGEAVNIEPDRLVSSPDPAEFESAAAPVIFGYPDAVQSSGLPQIEPSDDEATTDLEYVEFHADGPDNPPVIIQLPKKIRMQYGEASEEYFIRNVSH